MSIRIDSIDRAILRALQQNGRIQNSKLARQAGLTPPPCLRRVRRLEESGVIERYAALVDPVKVGMALTIFTRVWLTSQDECTISSFVETIQRLPQVIECNIMVGDSDFLLKVVAQDLDEYHRF
jgi:Lrp/AsnC family leucine-responsive transcriptional regulator